MEVDIVAVSSRGQIVLPMEMRKKLSISDGDRLAVFATDKVIVLKPLKLPTAKEFSGWLDEAQEWGKEAGYEMDDVNDVIRSVRRRKKK